MERSHMGKIERLRKDGKCNSILIKNIFLKYAVEVGVLLQAIL